MKSSAVWTKEETVGYRYVRVTEVEHDGFSDARARTLDGEWIECLDLLLIKTSESGPRQAWALAPPEYGGVVAS